MVCCFSDPFARPRDVVAAVAYEIVDSAEIAAKACNPCGPMAEGARSVPEAASLPMVAADARGC
jgi:hypothetical protein